MVSSKPLNSFDNMWTEQNNALSADLVFKNFNEAISFMTETARSIDKLNHHPEWSNVYNKVSIKLTTHDAGNRITDKDRKLAKILEDIYCKYQ